MIFMARLLGFDHCFHLLVLAVSPFEAIWDLHWYRALASETGLVFGTHTL